MVTFCKFPQEDNIHAGNSVIPEPIVTLLRYRLLSKAYSPIEVTELELSENQLSLLIFNNIFTLKNLKNMPVNSLICIFCTDIEKFINEIGKYTYSKKEILLNLKEGFNSIVKDEWAKVLDMRFAFNNYKRRYKI